MREHACLWCSGRRGKFEEHPLEFRRGLLVLALDEQRAPALERDAAWQAQRALELRNPRREGFLRHLGDVG